MDVQLIISAKLIVILLFTIAILNNTRHSHT